MSSPNKLLVTSVGKVVAFSAFDRASTWLTQPLLVVAGTDAGSRWQSEELHAAAAGPKQLLLLEAETHMSLYDGAGMELAAAKVAPFFTTSLH